MSILNFYGISGSIFSSLSGLWFFDVYLPHTEFSYKFHWTEIQLIPLLPALVLLLSFIMVIIVLLLVSHISEVSLSRLKK